MYNISKYRASHIRPIPEFTLHATKNTNDADHLIPEDEVDPVNLCTTYIIHLYSVLTNQLVTSQ
jgi:hypothetical protein